MTHPALENGTTYARTAVQVPIKDFEIVVDGSSTIVEISCRSGRWHLPLPNHLYPATSSPGKLW